MNKKDFNIVFLEVIGLIVLLGFISPWLISQDSTILTLVGVVTIIAPAYFASRIFVLKVLPKIIEELKK